VGKRRKEVEIMQIGFSERTLLSQITMQTQDIESETKWLRHYAALGEVECIEDCIRNIEESLVAIKGNLEYLKGEKL
jgi:hypothetical protein